MGNDTSTTDPARCPGCGQRFEGTRGLRAHQSARYVTLACRPIKAAR